MLFTTAESKASIDGNVDEFGDSYARDTNVEELKKVIFYLPFCKTRSKFILKQIFAAMPCKFGVQSEAPVLVQELEDHENDLGELSGWLFKGLVLYAEAKYRSKPNGVVKNLAQNESLPGKVGSFLACNTARFAGAEVISDLADERITHVVIGHDTSGLKPIREILSR